MTARTGSVFITGISGLLGLNLAFQWRDRLRTSGCYHARPVKIPQVETMALDVTDVEATARTIGATAPAVVVHTAGLTNVDACELDPMRAHRLHVDATAHVAAAARACGAALVHISTDHLFDGTKPSVSETTEPAPLNVYGRTKLAAEQVVAGIAPGALIVRTNFFGWGTSRRVSFSDWIIAGLRDGGGRDMFSDVFFSPMIIELFAETILELVECGASGVWHVAGSERLSKHEFGVRLARQFGYPIELIRARSIQGSTLVARRPRDMSLSTTKVERVLGRAMPDVATSLAVLHRQYREGLPRSLEQAVRRPDTAIPS